ncbi:MAG TPA: AtpZ/AtpI family protein [Bacteroidia bacterium]|jgi:F0F1-type ATP synthase assembly protein I|nr:AtpZ/AtpI family protein [Bacteroidia bacterium]
MTPYPPDKKPRPTNSNSVLKYSGMAFQILAAILLGFFGGMKLDEYLGFKKVPVFTLVLGLLGVVAGVYLSIKDFLKKK